MTVFVFTAGSAGTNDDIRVFYNYDSALFHLISFTERYFNKSDLTSFDAFAMWVESGIPAGEQPTILEYSSINMNPMWNHMNQLLLTALNTQVPTTREDSLLKALSELWRTPLAHSYFLQLRGAIVSVLEDCYQALTGFPVEEHYDTPEAERAQLTDRIYAILYQIENVQVAPYAVYAKPIKGNKQPRLIYQAIASLLEIETWVHEHGDLQNYRYGVYLKTDKGQDLVVVISQEGNNAAN